MAEYDSRTVNIGASYSIWKDHMKKIFSIQKQPRWKLEDFYVPHITELTPIPFYE